MNRRAVFVMMSVASACSLATNFDRDKTVEETAILCGDGTDNDADGLFDCQDWKCAVQPSCCKIPVIVLDDDFDDAACSAKSCDAPGSCNASAERWQEWGSPLPQLCQGGFIPGKTEQCYDVGLLSVQAAPLGPGLVLTAGLAGVPEQRGRVVVGLTFQTQVFGSLDPCAPIEPAVLALSISMVSAETGHRFIAGFGEREAGATVIVTDGDRHELVIRVTGDRRVEYVIDGTVFATSSETETVPSMERPVRVVVMGRGRTARVDDVKLTIGARCEAPAAWAMAPRFLDFDVRSAPDGWDSFAVYGPSVGSESTTEPSRLYFGGCGEAFGTCNPVIGGYGRATLGIDGTFERDQECPIVSNPGLVCPDGVVSPFTDVYNNVFDVDVVRGPAGLAGVLSQSQRGTEIALLVEQGGVLGISPDPGIDVGPAGSWDAAEVCCAAVVVTDDGRRRVWYSGRAEPDGPHRIGLAEWTDTGLVKSPDNPVLSEGVPGGIDDHGVSDPDVLWDAKLHLYRMWYVANGSLGLTSVAYAVSTDGAQWHRAPQNPVVTAEALSLRRIGAPAVVSFDGYLRMWLEGVPLDRPGTKIYALENGGVDP